MKKKQKEDRYNLYNSLWLIYVYIFLFSSLQMESQRENIADS